MELKNTKLDTVLITGSAGFIGAAIAMKLIKKGVKVVGVDNLNNYYDVGLKKSRLEKLNNISNSFKKQLWFFYKKSISNFSDINEIFNMHQPSVVINLAAQAGVRYSIENPAAYVESNLVGFTNILEACRKNKVKNLIYASSSSVYGGNDNLPYKETHAVDHPISLYAATKKSNEILAHSYSHLYGLNSTGLRFFTVYGPWGRPDMAPMIFAKNILNNIPINVFNNGQMSRDFTYIDDIVEGIYKCCFKIASPDSNFNKKNPNPSTSFAPHRIFNIGNNKSVHLMYFISVLEKVFKKKAKINYLPIQDGDVKNTCADIKLLSDWVNYKPKFNIELGIKKFASWYLEYYL